MRKLENVKRWTTAPHKAEACLHSLHCLTFSAWLQSYTNRDNVHTRAHARVCVSHPAKAESIVCLFDQGILSALDGQQKMSHQRKERAPESMHRGSRKNPGCTAGKVLRNIMLPTCGFRRISSCKAVTDFQLGDTALGFTKTLLGQAYA
eukprot:1161813-Pelagomonas_calceolata.AAC.6